MVLLTTSSAWPPLHHISNAIIPSDGLFTALNVYVSCALIEPVPNSSMFKLFPLPVLLFESSINSRTTRFWLYFHPFLLAWDGVLISSQLTWSGISRTGYNSL